MPTDSGLILSPEAPLAGEAKRMRKEAGHFSRPTHAVKTRRLSD